MKKYSFFGFALSVVAFLMTLMSFAKSPKKNFALVPGTCVWLEAIQAWDCISDPAADSCLTDTFSPNILYLSQAACLATNR